MKTCSTCGQPHLTPQQKPACPGHITNGPRKGEPCTNPLGYKTEHGGWGQCRYHGGMTESAKVNAKNMQVMAALYPEMHKFGVAPPVDPLEVLRTRLAESFAWVAWIEKCIEGLKAEELVWGKEKVEEGTGTSNRGGNTQVIVHSARISQWVVIYRDEKKELNTLVALALTHGLAEREVKIHEQQGKLLATLMFRLIEAPEMALSDDRREAAKGFVFKLLKELPAAAT